MSGGKYFRLPAGNGTRNSTLLNACLLALLAGIVAGCVSTPPVALPAQDIPSSWSEPVAGGADVWPEEEWWRGFASAELDGLVADARTNNLDLAAAAARVLQANAVTDIAGAALFPWVGLGAGAQRQSANDNGATTSSNAFGIAGLASYELDFWGVARSDLRAAEAMLRSTRYGQEVVALTVTSNVGVTYLDVLGARQRIDIARQNLDTAKRLLSAIERMVAAGLSSPLDLAQQQALVAGQEAEIPALEQQEREARYVLSLLLGRAPEGFSVGAQNLEGILIPNVAPGLPSELIRRRPDIAQAEAHLLAAHANVDAARGAFFPSIILTASGGIASGAVASVTAGPEVGDLIAEAGSTGLIYGVGVSLLQTIFDGGRLQGQSDFVNAQELELIANYRSVVFSAFSDVEAALSQSASLAAQERLKIIQVDSAARAFDISERQYREGLVGLLALLQAQQTLFEAQDQLVQIKLARIQATIGLYKALGGGWVETSAFVAVAED